MKLSFLYGATFGTLARLFVEHKGRISLKYLPIFILHLVIGVFNSILSIPDFFWRNKGLPKNIVFVLGHYRSGTTHLLNLLAEDGTYTPVTTYQAVFPTSFLTMEKVLSPLLNKIGPGVRAMDNMAMRMESPQEEEIALSALGAPTPYLIVHFPVTGKHYEDCISFENATHKTLIRWKRMHLKFVRKLVKKHGPEVTLILKSPANTARIPLLLEMYPNSKFVHIHRNPYRTIQSSLHLYDTWYAMTNFQSIKKLKENRNQIVLDVFELLSRKWLKDQDLIPAENKINISFQELQSNPVETINRIYNHLGGAKLDKIRLQKYLDSIKSYKKNSYEELTPELIQEINGKLDFVFEAFG